MANDLIIVDFIKIGLSADSYDKIKYIKKMLNITSDTILFNTLLEINYAQFQTVAEKIKDKLNNENTESKT